MNEHEHVRELLALAAAGALTAEEEQRLTRHLAACAECAAEMEAWRALSSALHRVPTPQAPRAVVEKALSRAEGLLVARAERRWNRGALVFIVLFSWTAVLAGWPLFRMASSGVSSLLNIGPSRTWFDLVLYTALTWLTAGVAAGVIAWQKRRERRFA